MEAGDDAGATTATATATTKRRRREEDDDADLMLYGDDQYEDDDEEDEQDEEDGSDEEEAAAQTDGSATSAAAEGRKRRKAEHACNICGRSYPKPWRLAEHMLNHTGEVTGAALRWFAAGVRPLTRRVLDDVNQGRDGLRLQRPYACTEPGCTSRFIRKTHLAVTASARLGPARTPRNQRRSF